MGYNGHMEKLLKKMPTWQKLILLIILTLLSLFARKGGGDESEVTLVSCVDGDTAQVMLAGKKERVRFIAIDAPELKSNDFYSKEAADYTCSQLKNAKNISLEFDPLADDRDKFDRLIAWVYVDDQLLQSSLVEKGYAKVRYIYDDYLYVDQLNVLQKNAKSKKIGLWAH